MNTSTDSTRLTSADWSRWENRSTFIRWATRGSNIRYAIEQPSPGAGLVWIQVLHDGFCIRELRRSGGAFYDNMGHPWHPSALVAAVSAVRYRCSIVRHWMREFDGISG